MNNTTCPCLNCICMPVCRHKMYPDLMKNCELVDTYVTAPEIDKSYRIRTVYHMLYEPHLWDISPPGD